MRRVKTVDVVAAPDHVIGERHAIRERGLRLKRGLDDGLYTMGSAIRAVDDGVVIVMRVAETDAVLFPDLAADRADEILVGWRDRLAETSGAGSAAKLATVTTCECNADGLAGHEEIVRLACAR